MTMKTITYDPAKYKLVPIEMTGEMMDAADPSGHQSAESISQLWSDILGAVTEPPESNHEVVCWVPLFIGSKKPTIDLAEETQSDLIANLSDCEGTYQCIPLIAKQD